MNMYYPKNINGEQWKHGDSFIFVLADSSTNAHRILRAWLSDRHLIREIEDICFCTMYLVPECFRLDPMTDASCVIISEADLQPSYINRIRRETDGQLLSRINAGVQLAAVWTNELQNAGQNRQRTIIEELTGLQESLQIRINEYMYRLNAGKENHNGMEQ